MFSPNQLLGIDLDYTFQGNSSVLIERFSENFPWIPLEFFLTANSKDDTKLIQSYKKLISDSDFQNLFSFKNIEFWNELEFFFEKMCFAPFLPFYSSLIHSIPTL